ncbi:hypothetical protein, partial [Leptospira interrogans]|uniref:hypothetical protein n=1 Tax=Leptospira interrogans TaxID=173 RepID=UPI001B8B0F73
RPIGKRCVEFILILKSYSTCGVGDEAFLIARLSRYKSANRDTTKYYIILIFSNISIYHSFFPDEKKER